MHHCTVATIFAAILALASGLTLEYRCVKPLVGTERSIVLKLSLGTDEIPVKKYYGGATVCPYLTTAGSEVTIKVALAAGSTETAATCGIRKSTVVTTLNKYDVVLTTASVENTVAGVQDRSFTFSCDYDQLKADEPVAMSAASSDVIAVAPTEGTETIALELINPANAVITSCVLGDDVKLRATLTRSPTAQGLKVITCTANDGGTTTPLSVNLLDVNGCGDKIIGTTDSFTKDTTVSTTLLFVSQTQNFKCFKFPSSLTVSFACTAQYLMNNVPAALTCPNTGRKRRSVQDTEQNVQLIVRIGTGGNDSVSLTGHSLAHPLGSVGGGECDNRSYLIGLVVLGCVLTLTFIVTVGMFVVIRRGRPEQRDMMGAVNKGMS